MPEFTDRYGAARNRIRRMVPEIFNVTRLEIGLGAPAAAGEAFRSATHDLVDPRAAADAILLVSELVTDVAASKHARTLGLTIRVADDVLYAGVESTGVLDVDAASRDRRKTMLDRLGTRWGSSRTAVNRRMRSPWFEIRLDRSS